MNTSFMQENRKSNRIIILIGILTIIVSVLLGVFFALQKEKIPETVQEIGVSSDLKKPEGITTVTFSPAFIVPSETLPIYQISTSNQDLPTFAAQIAQKLTMIPAQQDYLENTWFSIDQKSSLTITTKGSILFLSDIKEAAPSQVKFDFAMAAATTFLSQFIPIDRLTIDKTRAAYTSATGEDGGLGVQNIAIIPFTYNLNQYSFYMGNSLRDFSRVWVDSHNNVIKAEFFIPPDVTQTTETAQLPDKTRIEKSIINKQAEVLSTFFLQDKVSIEELTSVEIGSTQVQYRYTPQSSKVFPYIQLDAVGKAPDGRALAIRFLIQATAQ